MKVTTEAVMNLEAKNEQNLSEAVQREYARLRNFIRTRVTDHADAEDIVQDVFYELAEAYHSMKSIEQVAAWLFRVARNRITDRFRRRNTEALTNGPSDINENEESLSPDELLPSSDAGPESAYARSVLLEELESAVNELPEEQREVFIAHELEGASFKEMAAKSGLSINTLLARKRYAVLHLRRRLQFIYNEYTKS